MFEQSEVFEESLHRVSFVQSTFDVPLQLPEFVVPAPAGANVASIIAKVSSARITRPSAVVEIASLRVLI
jgi:hypothetical protein